MLICPQCGGREFDVVEIVCQRIVIRCDDTGSYDQTQSPRFMAVEEWDSVTCRDCDAEVDEGEAAELFEAQHPELKIGSAPVDASAT